MQLSKEQTRKALDKIKSGAKFPYDASDEWLNSDSRRAAPKSEDWAHTAARGILEDLKDRRGIKNGFSNVDEDVRVEIVASLRAIILLAHSLGSEG